MGTIQWTLVASFLYCEIFVIILLLLPFVPARMWQSVFRTRFCQFFARKINFYFMTFIAILVLLFVESIREMNKYSHIMPDHSHKHLDTEMQSHLKLFRSQRNYYISGLSLFLWFVIRKLIILILSHADLQGNVEQTMREAQQATERSEKLLREQMDQSNRINIEAAEMHAMEVKTLKDKLRSVEGELESIKNPADR